MRFSLGGGSFADSDTETLFGEGLFNLEAGIKTNRGHLGIGFETGFVFAQEDHLVNETILGITFNSLDLTALVVPMKITGYLNAIPTAMRDGGLNPYIGVGVGVYPYTVSADLDSNVLVGSETDDGVMVGAHFLGGLEYYFDSDLGLFLEVVTNATSDADIWGVDIDLSHTLIHGGLMLQF